MLVDVRFNPFKRTNPDVKGIRLNSPQNLAKKEVGMLVYDFIIIFCQGLFKLVFKKTFILVII